MQLLSDRKLKISLTQRRKWWSWNVSSSTLLRILVHHPTYNFLCSHVTVTVVTVTVVAVVAVVTVVVPPTAGLMVQHKEHDRINNRVTQQQYIAKEVERIQRSVPFDMQIQREHSQHVNCTRKCWYCKRYYVKRCNFFQPLFRCVHGVVGCSRWPSESGKKNWSILSLGLDVTTQQTNIYF